MEWDTVVNKWENHIKMGYNLKKSHFLVVIKKGLSKNWLKRGRAERRRAEKIEGKSGSAIHVRNCPAWLWVLL